MVRVYRPDAQRLGWELPYRRVVKPCLTVPDFIIAESMPLICPLCKRLFIKGCDNPLQSEEGDAGGD